MIPAPAITAWRARRPWRTDRQVAQDLLLSALAIEIASDEVTRGSLVWRGGTCLHQLHLPEPARYSEDIDYVLLAGTARYGDLDRAFLRIARTLDVSLRGKPIHEKERYKALVAAEAAGVGPIEIKVEINTAEVPPVLECIALPLTVNIPAWYEGGAEVPTFQPAELIGTKFRALAQRRKGRDLWDLDLARRALSIEDGDLAEGAAHYLKHAAISPAAFRSRLAEHVTTEEFLADLDPLLVGGVGDYDAAAVARRVVVWSDAFLDPLLPTHDQRRKGAATPSDLRCPEYARAEGTLSRCERRVALGARCPDHAERGPVNGW